jgi:peptidoglycan glycosyltransferase
MIGAALSGSLMAFAAPGGAGSPAAPPLLPKTPAAALTRVASAPSPTAGFDPLSHRLDGDKLVSDLPGGRLAELTLEPSLQAHLTDMLRDYDVPYGALVALEPATGRVLAYVSHSSANPDAGDLARDASAPSASVFKLVTAAALIDAGVGPDERVCYAGGLRHLALSDLADNPARDRACATLEQAIGKSLNAVVAKLADRKLDQATLERYAQAFGFGTALPFDAPTQPSPAEVLGDRLELARTAAGFWHMYMSPLHGALIGATIANGGVMPRAAMIERVLDAEGRTIYSRAPGATRNVISASTAKTLGHMMETTVTQGTARAAFHDAHNRPLLPGIAVAGKTGSLSSERPYRAYSWWVGYAPEAAPEIAVAALVVNTPRWRIKGGHLAREALRYYLIDRKAQQRKAAARTAAVTPAAAPAPAAAAASASATPR